VLDYEAMRSIVVEPQESSRRGGGGGGGGKTDGHLQDDAAWRENFEELEAYVAGEGHPHVRKDCGELGQVLCLLLVHLRVCAPSVKDMCKMNVKMIARVFSLHLWLHPVQA
jgi:hypothetical protein